MIDIHLYRIRSGNLIPRVRKLKSIKPNEDYLKHRLGRIFLLSCKIMSILPHCSEGLDEYGKNLTVGFLRGKNYQSAGIYRLQWRKFRVNGDKRTSNYQPSRMLHGKEIIKKHVNTESISHIFQKAKNSDKR